MKNILTAEVFPVGDFIREEMEAREWTVDDLAQRAVLPHCVIEGLINGSTRMRCHHAERIGVAFGTSGALWINLNHAYRSRQEQHP